MDRHINEFYNRFCNDTPSGNFHEVIALHNHPLMEWNEVSLLVPTMPRGWFELSRLSIQDRIEFTRDFWLSKLPYHPKLSSFLTPFFASLDDIGVFLVQQKFDDPFEANLIYSLKDNGGFFRGGCPANDLDIEELQKKFAEDILPNDYKVFLQIHDGFSKATDCTGVIKSSAMKASYESFQALLSERDPLTTTQGRIVNPKKLIPFYESFGMPFFQCFWGEWYPEQEMGNVYYSGLAITIPDVDLIDAGSENMIFPTFLDWLMFYMERIE